MSRLGPGPAGRDLLLDLLPAGLEALVEGAWVAVLYAAIEVGPGHRELELALPAFFLAAAAGLAAGRRLHRGRAAVPVGGWAAPSVRRVIVGVALVVAAAVVGWLAAPEVRTALGGPVPTSAIDHHPGGWLLGLAALRGLAHADPEPERGASGALRIGLPVLVAVWLLVSPLPAPDRLLFQSSAFPDTVVFMIAGLLAAGLAGMRGLGHQAGFDWRRNRQWLGLLIAVVALMGLLAVPWVALAGRPMVDLLVELVRPALGLVALILLIRAIPQTVRLMAPFLAVGIPLVILIRLLNIKPADLTKALSQLQPKTPAKSGPSAEGPVVEIGTVLIVVGLIALSALVTWLWLRRRRRPRPGDVFEERAIVVESTRLRLPRLPTFGWVRGRPAEPRDAVAAYRASLAELARYPDLERAAAESPAEHARRIRGRGAGPALGRLALDYELVRFGGRRLGDREEARALARWHRLRDALRARPAGGRRSARRRGPSRCRSRRSAKRARPGPAA